MSRSTIFPISYPKYSLISAICFLCFLTLIDISAHCASVKKPEFKISFTATADITIKWKVTRKLIKRSNLLEIVASRDGGEFLPVSQYEKFKRRGSFDVRSAKSGLFKYRVCAKLKNGKNRCSRSKAVKISVSDDYSPSESEQDTDADTEGTPSGEAPRSTKLKAGQQECPAGFAEEVLRLVNKKRKATGVAKVTNHPQLAWSARAHTVQLAEDDFLSHDGWFSYIETSRYPYSMAGENIAYGYKTPAEVMTGWMNSSGHKKNILYEGYEHLGVGCIIDKRGRFWWTQHLGSD